MNLTSVINKRRTIRDFSNRQVDDVYIHSAIRNAFKAPSYNHLREWHFMVIRDDEQKKRIIQAENLPQKVDKKQLESTFSNEDPIMKEMYLNAIPKQMKMIFDAPVVIVVIFKPKIHVKDATRIYDLNCLASVWAAIENLLLTLTESKILGVTYVPKDTSKVKQALFIPDELEIAAIIPIGYRNPYRDKILPKPEIDINQRIHWDQW